MRRSGPGRRSGSCAPWACCRWTPARWTTCTTACSTPSRRRRRVIVKELSGHKGDLTERLWSVMEHPDKGHEAGGCGRRRPWRPTTRKPTLGRGRRPGGGAAGRGQSRVPGRLDGGPAAGAGKLLGPLAAVFRDRKEERTAERTLATSILADYAADRPETLADLLMDADEKQFAVLFPKVQANAGPAAALLNETVGKQLDRGENGGG